MQILAPRVFPPDQESSETPLCIVACDVAASGVVPPIMRDLLVGAFSMWDSPQSFVLKMTSIL